MTDELREAIARIIDPSSWRVMDSMLEQTLRKYRGQNVGWPADQFKDKASLKKADVILALPEMKSLIEAAGEVEKLREMGAACYCRP